MWAGADGADGDVCTGDRGAGVCAAGERGWLKGFYGKRRGAGSLLARLGTLLDVAGGNVVAGSEVGGVDGGFRTCGHHLAAIAGPGVDGGLLGVGVERVCGYFDRVAGEHAWGLSAAAEHDGIRRLDVAEAGNEAT